MPVSASDRTRDAERSRDAILASAERLFAEQGYEPASLNQIGAEAGLSRGTPSYFFGSKEALYSAVLERAFAARHEATEAAFEPVRAWCDGAGGPERLRIALGRAAEGYIDFLLAHPSFVRLIMREELDGGRRLRSRPMSTAMEDAFRGVRRAGRGRGIRSFRVEDAVLLFVTLTFAPVSYQRTLGRALDFDLSRPGDRRRHVKLAVDQLMRLLTG